MLKYILEKQESEDLLAKYLNSVFLRRDVLDNLTDLFKKAGVNAVKDKETRQTAQDFIMHVVKNRSIKEGLLENYLYSPIKSFISFGFQEAEDEKLKREQERQRKFKEDVKRYNDARKSGRYYDDLATYPGYDQNQEKKQAYSDRKEQQRKEFKE
mmetsp:Transcript_18438/g.31540  ORF Transcript_18438/g.31540 Transcript_18438/m.31540 type:complete len:155 (+) Transcript_18438:862-1326(+)